MICGGGGGPSVAEYPWYAESVTARAPDGVLAGKRIVMYTTVLAAPATGALLADLGAEVIKIESPSGDPMRHLIIKQQPNRGKEKSGCTMFEYTNRGVQSVTLNLKKEEDQHHLKSLLTTADAFVTNARLQLLQSWGLDYEDLKESHPHLVYGHFTAWGRSGPMAEDIGYDVASFNAALGMMEYMAQPGDPGMPRYPTGLGDFCCSVGLAGATMCGLLEREWSHKGQLVEFGLLTGAAWCMSSALLSVQSGTKEPHASALLDSLVAPGTSWGNKAFRTSDQEWLTFSCLDVAEQPRALRALGIAEQGAGVEAALTAAIASRSLQDSLELLRLGGVDWASGAVEMEDAVKLDIYETLACELPQMKDCDNVICQPVVFGSHVAKPTRRAPPLGFHTHGVLNALQIVGETREPEAPLAQTKNARGGDIRSFADFRVVELGDSVCAAAGGVQLAEIGCEVIKVERAAGDPTRHLALKNVFEHLNRGKRSVVLQPGEESLRKLVASADVFLVSLPREELIAAGLDWDSLQPNFPNLVFIHVSPSGYGKPGWHGLGAEFVPFYTRGAGLFDSCRPQARLPFADDKSPPPQLVPFWGEHATSFQIVVAAAGALIHRLRKGQGQKAEVRLESTPFWFMGVNTMAAQYLKNTSSTDMFNDPKSRYPFKHMNLDKNGLRCWGGIVIPGLQSYKCSDGCWIQLLELELLSPLGKIHDALDRTRSGKTKRSAAWNALFYRGALLDRVTLYLGTFRNVFAELIASMPRDEVADRFGKEGVRYIKVGEVRKADENPQVQHLGLLQDGVIRAPVILRGGASKVEKAQAPNLGEGSVAAFL